MAPSIWVTPNGFQQMGSRPMLHGNDWTPFIRNPVEWVMSASITLGTWSLVRSHLDPALGSSGTACGKTWMCQRRVAFSTSQRITCCKSFRSSSAQATGLTESPTPQLQPPRLLRCGNPGFGGAFSLQPGTEGAAKRDGV